jgi:hypothetical protein
MRLAALAIFGVLSISMAKADVMVGVADSGNCIPLSCPGTYDVTQYQQLYAASDFTGPITITGLTFFDTLFNGGTLSAGTFTLSLSTVSTTLAGFNSIISVGADNTQIYSGTLGTLPFGGSITLGGGSFNYNPADGSLLLNILLSGGSTQNNQYLDATSGDSTLFSRETNGDNNGTTGFGLVTRFDTSNSPVPEPASVLLLSTVLAGAGLAVKRKFAA